MSTDRQPTRPETDPTAAAARRRPSDRRRGHERLLAGRYRLEAPIGEGGMATIYRARDEQLGREVAVKLLRPQFGADPTFSARFRQEAQSAAGLAHPNVVAIFDYGAEDGAQFIVMELVRGRTLAALLAERGPLPVDMAVEVAAQVASALEAAHRNGLVHRDVKPGNILVSDDGRVKVADFGIARAVSEASLTAPGTTLGSVHYFSPEQARGEPVTGSSDVYSLGIVLFEMLTGRRPFEAETAMGVVMRRIRERAPSVRAFDPTLPQPLVRIVDRALARRPSGRFASAAAFESALRSLDLPIAWAPRAEVPATPAPSTRSGADQFGSGPASSVRQGTVYGRVPGAARPVHRDRVAAGRPGAPRPASHQRPASGPGPARWRSPVAAPSSDEPRRRLPAPLFLVLGLVAALGLVGGALAFDAIGRDSRAEQPAPTRVADGPTAAPTERPTARPTPAPTPAPTPPRTPEPTPEPTVRPTETPTPQPTARPTPPSTVGRPSLTPAQTVAYWYALVDDGEFDRAAALWSRRMRANYPPERYIDGRFAATDSIEARRARTTSVGDGRARVAVDVIEIVDGERRRWVGSWDLVRGPNGWLLDDPNF